MTDSPKVTQARSTFARSCGVEVEIRAPADVIWALLTDAQGFPSWNTTVTSLEGEIRDGQRLALRVPISDRTFRPTVSDVEPNKSMKWSDGFAPMFRGVRTFELAPRGDGVTSFSMVERFSGLMLPLIGGTLPDFAPAFEQYAKDLKKEAQRKGTERSRG